jgi:hypothetical protein
MMAHLPMHLTSEAETEPAPPHEIRPHTPRVNFFPISWLWFSLVALELLFLAKLHYGEADIWFHLRNAKELLTAHSFLRADRYTFTSTGSPLLNFEWLSELPYYEAYRLLGPTGLLLVYLFVLWLIFGAVYYIAIRRGATYGDAALATMAAAVLGSYSFGPRMLHFGWLCLAGLLLLLEFFPAHEHCPWLLPPLFALWINLHGSWVFGAVVLAIYFASGMVEGRWNGVVAHKWTPAQRNKLVAASGLSIVAMLLNPYGYRLLWYPFELLTRQSAVRYSVVEWQSVDFHTGWGKLAVLMLTAVLAAAWFSPRPWPLRDVLLVSFAVWASLIHVRFLLFAAIILIPILSPRLGALLRYDAERDKPWLNVAFTTLVAIIIVWVFPAQADLQRTIDVNFPRHALAFLQGKHINGRLLHFYDYGGYIEWNAPSIPTFADGRADIFAYNGVLEDYLKINSIDNSLALLDRYQIRYVLFPKGKRLPYLLAHAPGWELIYSDNVAQLFERTSPTDCRGVY